LQAAYGEQGREDIRSLGTIGLGSEHGAMTGRGICHAEMKSSAHMLHLLAQKKRSHIDVTLAALAL
jgi:hypothetical protein